MRLNQFLASAGLGSRRSCEELIQSGQVTINGTECTNLATRVEPTDVVKAGNRVLHSAAPTTLLLHKPPGFICTAADTHDRRTIFDLLPPNFPRLFHVGRLDRESEGLIILTNDGALALKLTHPRYKVEKEYEVVLDHAFDFELSAKLIHGMNTQEGWAKAESVHRLGGNKVKVILRQGLKRQIRLMFYELGYEVKRLVRTRIGPIHIQGLPPGAWRALNQREIESLVAKSEKSAAEAAETFSKTPRRPAAPKKPGWPRREPSAKKTAGPTQRRPVSKRPASDRPEEIPFTPRAAREGGEAAATRRAPFAKKPRSKFSGKAKPGGKPAAGKAKGKEGPHAFAKFQRRERKG